MFKRDSTAHNGRGTGLARGPAYIVGAILALFGLILLVQNGSESVSFPTAGFPDGDETAGEFLGFENNGWTAWITIAAGVLLLIGAAQHGLAKAMSLAVGLALGACAIIALIDGDVLGLAAANWATELGWGIAAVILVLNVLAPRVGGDDHTHSDRAVEHDRASRGVAVDRDRDGVDDRQERSAPVVDRDRDGVDDRHEHSGPAVDRDRDGVDDRAERRTP